MGKGVCSSPGVSWALHIFTHLHFFWSQDGAKLFSSIQKPNPGTAVTDGRGSCAQFAAGIPLPRPSVVPAYQKGYKWNYINLMSEGPMLPRFSKIF